jgi:hypothetical protein
MLAAGDYQGASTLYTLRYFPIGDGRVLSISFASPKGATIGIVIDKNKQFAITINNYYYMEEVLKSPQFSGLFSDTEEIQDDQLGALVEEALVFFENLFDLRGDDRRRENEKRHADEKKKLLDQI